MRRHGSRRRADTRLLTMRAENVDASLPPPASVSAHTTDVDRRRQPVPPTCRRAPARLRTTPAGFFFPAAGLCSRKQQFGGRLPVTVRRLLAATVAVAWLFANPAAAQAPAAITGQVTSAAEGPMEGVLVTAQRDGAQFAISVST